MMIIEKCPSQLELRALSLGQIPEERSDEMLVHLQNCENCQAELGTSDQADDSLLIQLRSGSDAEDYSREAECQTALAQALGALSNHSFPLDYKAQSINESELSRLLPDVLGEYEIVRPIGSGGMGAVFLARHTKLGRQVALKVLSSHRLMQPRMRKRFESEMRSIGQLSHPNIVTAHDAREFDKISVLVTEYIDGLDIGQILRRLGKLPIADACEITKQIALALEYVNSQGLVHRDIKPSNVMLGKTGNVKLLDLGLARHPFRDEDHTEMTVTGQAMGTADYIAPEQVNDSRNVDIRADIYSLGCTLYKMLCGRPPFDNASYPTSFAKMTAHVTVDAPPIESQLPDVPKGLAELLRTMISKNANDRPQTPAEVASLLENFTAGSKLTQLVNQAAAAEEILGPLPRQPVKPSPAKPELAPTLFRRNPFLSAITAGLLGVALGFGLGYAFGITITIKNPDGTVTKIEVPDGAKAIVSQDGDVEIELANSEHSQEGSAEVPSLGGGSGLDSLEIDGEDDNEFPFQIIADNGRIRYSNVAMLQGIWRLVGSSEPGAPELLGFVDDKVLVPSTKGLHVHRIKAKALDGFLYWNATRYRSEFIDGHSVDISDGKTFQNYERVALLRHGENRLSDLNFEMLPKRYQHQNLAVEIEKFKSDPQIAKFWDEVSSIAAKRRVFDPVELAKQFGPIRGAKILPGAWLVERSEPKDNSISAKNLEKPTGDPKANPDAATKSQEVPRALFFDEQQLFVINQDKSITLVDFEVIHDGDFNIIVNEQVEGSKDHVPTLLGTFRDGCAENRFTISCGDTNWDMDKLYSHRRRTVGNKELETSWAMEEINDADLKHMKGKGKTHDLVDAFSAIAEYQRNGKFPEGVEVKTRIGILDAKIKAAVEAAPDIFESPQNFGPPRRFR